MTLAEAPPVKVKADRNGLTLVPDPAASFDAIMAFMDERLKQSREFFHKTDMVLDLRTRPMRTDEILALYEKLYEKAQVKVVEVRLSDDLSFSVEGDVRKSRVKATAGRPGAGKLCSGYCPQYLPVRRADRLSIGLCRPRRCKPGRGDHCRR